MEQKELIKALLEITSPKAKIDDFMASFKVAVDALNKMKAATGSELSQLRMTFDTAVKNLQDSNLKDITDIKGQIDVMLGKALKTHEVSLNQLRDSVARMQRGKQGDAGSDADEEAIISAVLAQMPPVVVPDAYDDTELQAKLDDHAKTLEELKAAKGNGTPGWGAHPIQVFNSAGTVIDTVARNFKFGTNLTTTRSPDGVVTVNATGGGSGFTTLLATETPNGSTTVFTFSTATAQPSYVVSDNVWLKPTSAAGTVNWTWNAGTKQAILTIPPNDDIFAVV